MSAKAQLIGKRFGRLVVVEYAGANGSVLWSCRCDCGNTTVAITSVLTTGEKKSCGCLWRKHDGWKNGRPSKEYATWISIKQRCYNHKCLVYREYGAKGVRVCAEWRRSFKVFFDHMGHAPSSKHSINRIDPTRGYEPGNCVWSTSLEQGANRKNSRMVCLRGEMIHPAEAARRLGSTLLHRLEKYDWDLEKAVASPTRRYTFIDRKASTGERNTPEYRAWLEMRNRCNNPNAIGYPNYGGADIRICPRWDNYQNFLADMGRRPSHDHSIERENPFGHYGPRNCHWGTREEQANNKRNTRFHEHGGKRLTLRGWAHESGIPYSLLKSRMGQGWTIAAAVSTPLLAGNFRAKRYEHDGHNLTLREWSERVGIALCTIEYRIKSGWPLESAITATPDKTARRGPSTRAVRYAIDGEFATVAEWAKRIGLHPSAIQHRIRSGWPIERALTEPAVDPAATSRSRARLFKYKGQQKTLRDWAEHIDIAYATLAMRLRRGWALEQALETPRHVELAAA